MLSDAHLGDHNRLRQVLLNLGSNAVKFTQWGQVELIAALEADGRASQRLRLQVCDTGPGIAPEHHKAIFERFVKVGEHGVGLGLPIVKQLVELMGGTVDVESDPGSGSKFAVCLTLPKAPANKAAHATVIAPMPAQRILVVDDVDLNRELAATLLTQHGHEVDVVSSGAEAMARCAQVKFDVVLMDVRMPGMDGMEATRAIRSGGGASAGATILALSAGARANKLAACLAAGMDAFVAKPIQEEELLRTIAAWTGAKPPSLNSKTAGVDELRERFRERLATDRTALAIGACSAGFAELVHRMAGSAGSFGFDEIGARAGALDDLLIAGSPDVADALVALLRAIDAELEPRAA